MAIDVRIEAGDWTEALPEAEAVVRRAVEATLATAAPAGRGEVAVLLADDEAVRALNARFRGKDRPTNVLSFPAVALPADPEPPLGDIVLAFGVCRDEARAQSKTLADHLTHLVAHGVLHLLGRDHETEAEAETMEAEERALLARLGVADPYGPPDDR